MWCNTQGNTYCVLVTRMCKTNGSVIGNNTDLEIERRMWIGKKEETRSKE